MVVLRFIGDEWEWDDKVALAVPPQKAFNMCITQFVKKLGVDKWKGMTLYRTEGKPPKFCRPTVPIDLGSNAQRERFSDGTVVWIKVNVDAARMEADRQFQEALEQWRKEKGIKGVKSDGSDVQEFIEEGSSRLNPTVAREVTELEESARDKIEGDEHRQYEYITFGFREMRKLQDEEKKTRAAMQTAFTTERHTMHESTIMRGWEQEIRRTVHDCEASKRKELQASEGTTRDSLTARESSDRQHALEAEASRERQRLAEEAEVAEEQQRAADAKAKAAAAKRRAEEEAEEQRREQQRKDEEEREARERDAEEERNQNMLRMKEEEVQKALLAKRRADEEAQEAAEKLREEERQREADEVKRVTAEREEQERQRKEEEARQDAERKEEEAREAARKGEEEARQAAERKEEELRRRRELLRAEQERDEKATALEEEEGRGHTISSITNNANNTNSNAPLKDAVTDVLVEFQMFLEKARSSGSGTTAPSIPSTSSPRVNNNNNFTNTVSSMSLSRSALFGTAMDLCKELRCIITILSKAERKEQSYANVEAILAEQQTLLKAVLELHRKELECCTNLPPDTLVSSTLDALRRSRVAVAELLEAVGRICSSFRRIRMETLATSEELSEMRAAHRIADLAVTECAATAFHTLSTYERRVFHMGKQKTIRAAPPLIEIEPAHMGHKLHRVSGYSQRGATRVVHCGQPHLSLHPDTLDVLVNFAMRYSPVPAAPEVEDRIPLPAVRSTDELDEAIVLREQQLRSDPRMRVYFEAYVLELLCQMGSAHATADEMCWAAQVRTHPQRELFQEVIDERAPYLNCVIDLLLHLYLSHEAELMASLCPEVAEHGSFSAYNDGSGNLYYYHNTLAMSQWEQPSSSTLALM